MASKNLLPRCKHFEDCGGCRLQHLTYDQQLDSKQGEASQLLADWIPTEAAPPIVPMADPWRYRNKAELSFGLWDGIAHLGYHARKPRQRIVSFEDCHLLPKAACRIQAVTLNWLREIDASVYHTRRREGWLRHLLIRYSKDTGKLMVGLVTTTGADTAVESWQKTILTEPAVDSVYWGINDKPADTALPDEWRHLAGERYLTDRIGGFSVRVYPETFLQASHEQADALYRFVASNAIGEIAWDVYCGVGLIGFYLSKQCRKIFGIEAVKASLVSARENAAANEISNIEFHSGPAEDVFYDRNFWLRTAKPDTIVLDPPRVGLHLRVISTVLAARPRRIIYVSCNPKALARDLKTLTTSFPAYQVRDIRLFDMFPQTGHMETVAILDRADCLR